MTNKTAQWEKEFDKQIIARCSDLSEHQEQIENFISSQIIEKIIGDYDEALSLEEIGYLTKDRVKQLKDKWL